MTASPDETKNLAGENVLRLIQIRLATLSLQKISLVRQDNFAARASAIARITENQLAARGLARTRR
jgi:hypothetical protein